MPSHTITSRFSAAGDSLSYDNTYTASGRIDVTETIPAETNDFAISVTIDVSEVESLFLVSNKDVTVETNDGTTPDDTISLKAGVPYVWNADSYDAFVFGTDITSLHVSNQNGAGVEATLELRCIVDVTP